MVSIDSIGVGRGLPIIQMGFKIFSPINGMGKKLVGMLITGIQPAVAKHPCCFFLSSIEENSLGKGHGGRIDAFWFNSSLFS